jgi:hypothetical protein
MLSYSETEKGPRLSLHVSVNTAKLSEQDKNAVEFQIQAHTEFDSSTEFFLDPNAIVLTVGSDVIHPIKIRRGCTLQSRRFRIHPYQFAIRVLATVDLRAFLFITPNLNLLTGLRFSYVLAPYREAINRSRYQYFDSPRKSGISLDAALRLGIMPCSACMRNESTPTWRLTLPPCSHSDIAYNVERVRHPISFCLFTLSIAMSGLSPELH